MRYYLSIKPEPRAQEVGANVRQQILTVDNPTDADVIMAIGGDGSLLHAIRSYYQFDRPFVGLHAGSEGALCLLRPETLVEDLEAIDDQFPVMVPLIDVFYNGEHIRAVQDARIERRTGKPIHARIEIDGQLLSKCHAGDGLIIANALGSTGYTRSAGGQVLPMGTLDLELTPVCPTHSQIAFDNLMRAQVIGSKVAVLTPREEVCLVIDNCDHFIGGGTRVEFRRSDQSYYYYPKEGR